MDYIEVIRILQKMEDNVLSWEDGRKLLIMANVPQLVINATIGEEKP